MDKQYLKIENAAEMIDVSHWTLRRWIKEKKIRTYKFGGSVRIKISDLMAFAKVTPSRYEIKEKVFDA